MTATLYVEGGGDGRSLRARFREGWSAFLTSKRYSKGRVSFELLARIDPGLVEQACPHARALLDRLRAP